MLGRVAALVALVTTSLSAQMGVPRDWEVAWSPLAPLAGTLWLPRHATVPSMANGGRRLSPGLFQTGVPAGLALEFIAPRADFYAFVTRARGSYRRSFDADDVSIVGGGASAARPLGDLGAAVARVYVHQEDAGTVPFATVAQPFRSDPIVLIDTTSPTMRRVRARLEGAMGWRFGSWGVGAALGLETGDRRTVNARFPRLARTAAAGVTLSLARAFDPGALRVAGYIRWQRAAETVSLVALSGDATVFILDGFSEADPREIGRPGGQLTRRIERQGKAVGGALAGELGAVQWSFHAERMFRTNRHFNAVVPKPASDTWDADGWCLTMGMLVQRLGGAPIFLAGELRYATLSGDANRAGLDGVILRARERFSELRVQLGWISADSASKITMQYHVARAHRFRRDFIADVRLDLVEWTPTFAAAVERVIGRFTAAVAIGVAPSSAVGTIPDPTTLGSVYRTFVAPSLGFAARQSLSIRGSVELRRRMTRSTTLLIGVHHVALRPRGTEVPPLAPGGTHKTWTVSTAVIVQ